MGIGGAFLVGLLLSAVITPCGAPVLATVQSYAALKKSLLFGGLLLFAYGLGAGAPVAVTGTGGGVLAARFDKWVGRETVDRVTGWALVALAVYLLATA